MNAVAIALVIGIGAVRADEQSKRVAAARAAMGELKLGMCLDEAMELFPRGVLKFKGAVGNPRHMSSRYDVDGYLTLVLETDHDSRLTGVTLKHGHVVVEEILKPDRTGPKTSLEKATNRPTTYLDVSPVRPDQLLDSYGPWRMWAYAGSALTLAGIGCLLTAGLLKRSWAR